MKVKKMSRMGRQGDVLLLRFDYIHLLGNIGRNKDGILALGEASGHKHQLKGDYTVNTLNGGSSAVQIHTDTELIHDGPLGDKTLHNPIPVVSPGPYLAYIQRELNPFTQAMQNVQD